MNPNAKDPVSEITTRLSRKSVVWNYLVVPHAHEDTGTLLDANEEPVWLNYELLPWKELGDYLQSKLTAAGLPKSIKVYVGDEAFDLHDINSLDWLCKKHHDYEIGDAASDCIKNSTSKDFRGGLFKGPSRYESFHLNTETQLGLRSPVSAYFVSFRFSHTSQAGDYISKVTEVIFGTPHRLGWSNRSDYMECAIPRDLYDWLTEKVGVVYGKKHAIIPQRAIFNMANG